MRSANYQTRLDDVERLLESQKAKGLLGREYAAWLNDPALIQVLVWADENLELSQAEAWGLERMLDRARYLELRDRPDLPVLALFDPDEGTPAEIGDATTLEELARGLVSLAVQQTLSLETIHRAQAQE